MQGVGVCVVLPSSQHQPGGDSTALHRDSVLAGLKPAPTLSVCSEVGLVRKGSCWGARKGFSPAGQGQTSLLRGEEHTKGSAALRYMGRGGGRKAENLLSTTPTTTWGNRGKGNTSSEPEHLWQSWKQTPALSNTR